MTKRKRSSGTCIFCKFVDKKMDTSIVFENDHVLAFLDIEPAGTLSGHTLVIPKNHFVTIDKVEDADLHQMMLAVKKLIPAIKKVSGAEGINLVQNNGKAAGQYVMHAHMHLIPRAQGDGIWFETKRRKMAPLEQLYTSKAIKKALGRSVSKKQRTIKKART